MGITKRHTPGCTCCEPPPCPIITRTTSTQLNDTYTTCAGTFTSPSEINGFKTATSNAKILFDYDFTGTSPWKATVNVKIKSSVANEVFSVRLIGACENPGTGYCNGTGVYFEYEGVSNGKYQRLHNGVEQPYDTTSCTNDSGITTTELTITMTLCWDGTTLTGSTSTTQPNLLATRLSGASLPPGSRFGIATGTLGANITYVEFYDFQLIRERVDCGECPLHCCGDTMPAQMVVEITGLSGTSYSFSQSGFSCTCDCSIFDGTYYLDQSQGFSTDCAGEGSCQWVSSDNGGNTASCAPDPDQTFSYRVGAAINVISGVRKVVVNIDAISPQWVVVASATFSTLCTEELVDWVDLEQSGSVGVFGSLCDSTGISVCRIKIV